MDRKWMNKTLLALSIQMIIGVAYAAEEPQLGEYETTAEQQAEVSEATTEVSATTAETNSTEAVVTSTNGQQAASTALQQQEGDATKEANLEEVFTSNERQYSLMKQGEISSYYDIDYTYYRDTQLDLEMAQGQLYQLRVQENASHALTNTFTAQYGLRDNLTLSASLPLVAKSDLLKDATAAGLGDISLGARWEPFPLKAGRLPLILFANLSTKTGDSPYEINLSSI